MNYITESHRNAETLFLHNPLYSTLYAEVQQALESITEEDLINEFRACKVDRPSMKSLSEPINKLIKERLMAMGWADESPIFNDPEYRDGRDNTRWRLDFAKEEISIEVAFNHGEAISWNLIKPVLASELNHVEKAIQTSAGIVICATGALKRYGNFDGAVGEFEKFKRYLVPMYSILTAPLMLIGLEAPTTFRIDPATKDIQMTV